MHPRRCLATFLVALFLAWSGATAQDLALPNLPDSVKFAAFGDMGSGDKPQYEVAQQMMDVRKKFPFDFVIMLGDDLYGSQQPKDFVKKFEAPYKPLLDAGVKFYAALGNHDEQTNRFYKYWNMDGKRFYSYTKKNVRFIVLDSDYLDPDQLKWVENELRNAKEDWKICYFHHPLYSSGGRHGSEVDLRVVLEPLFVKYGVNVVFSGHDHIYERIKPQKGVYYFVSGSGGQLRVGDLHTSALTAAGYDKDQTFMLVEIAGDTMTFQAITRTGKIVDGGTIARQTKPGETTATQPSAGNQPSTAVIAPAPTPTPAAATPSAPGSKPAARPTASKPAPKTSTPAAKRPAAAK